MSAAIIGQGASDLFGFLQGLSSSGSTNAAAAASGTDSTGSSNASSGSTTGVSGHHHHKHGGGDFEKLANAITSALQSASNGSSGSVADANQTITAALTKIFSNGSLNPTGDADSTDTTQQTTGTDPTAGSSNTSGGLPTAFVQTLKSFGVTPQQFQTDLSSALAAVGKNGQVDLSSLFKSFPTGSAVDTVG